MKAFLRRGTYLFSRPASPSQKQDGDKFGTASQDELFKKVDPAIDGEDCDRDCATCTVRLPAKWDIDLEDKLYGHVNAWATHILVATGKTDWVRDVADEQGSLMEAIEKGGLEPSNGALKLSASNMPVPDEYHHHEHGKQPTTVLILPAFTIVDHVTPQLVTDLIKYFINTSPTATTPLPTTTTSRTPLPVSNGAIGQSLPPSEPSQGNEEIVSQDVTPSEPQPWRTMIDLTTVTSLRSRPCPHAAVILLCSQRTRDARCGQSAPLLRREFERHLRARGLYRDLNDERPGGVAVYFISHVGGHKYSANVIVYRRRDFEWYRKSSANGNGTNNSQRQSADDRVGIGEQSDARRSDGTTATPKQEVSEEDEGAAQCIWIARVRPEDCEGIVKFTVMKGKVVKPDSQLRGGFDREKQLVSW